MDKFTTFRIGKTLYFEREWQQSDIDKPINNSDMVDFQRNGLGCSSHWEK
jgi:hypothetical protein